MQTTITSGRQLAVSADLADSRFEDVNLARARFENVNLSRAEFHDVNFSDVVFEAAQIGGTTFRHIGPHPQAGPNARQRGVTFTQMQLCDSVFEDVNLSGVRIERCDVTGMTLDGVLVTDLLAAYNARAR